MKPDGGAQEQITTDDLNNQLPHISPENPVGDRHDAVVAGARQLARQNAGRPLSRTADRIMLLLRE
jgi:hypothetical protein